MENTISEELKIKRAKRNRYQQNWRESHRDKYNEYQREWFNRYRAENGISYATAQRKKRGGDLT